MGVEWLFGFCPVPFILIGDVNVNVNVDVDVERAIPVQSAARMMQKSQFALYRGIIFIGTARGGLQYRNSHAFLERNRISKDFASPSFKLPTPYHH